MMDILKNILIVAFLAVLAGCATNSDQQAIVTQAAEVDASEGDVQQTATEVSEEGGKANKEKKVCKRRYLTGSRFPKKICKTTQEWDDMAERGEDATEELQQRGRVVNEQD